MTSLSFFVVLLVLRMHAGIAARPLDVMIMGNLLSHKEVDRSNAHGIASRQHEVKHWMVTERSVTRFPETKGGSRIWDLTNTVNLKKQKARPAREQLNSEILGDMITSSRPRSTMQVEATDILDLRGVNRSILESTLHQGDGSTESVEPIEDVVVMDYVHPYKKPPIHNLTP